MVGIHGVGSSWWPRVAARKATDRLGDQMTKLGTLARKRVYSETFRTGDQMTTPLVGKRHRHAALSDAAK